MHGGTGRLGGSNPTHDKSPTWTMCIWRLFPFSAFPQKGKLCWQVCWCRVRTQPSGEMVFRGWFCVTQPRRKKNSLPMQKYFRKRDFSAISVIFHSIFQITLGRDELALVAVERDMMPGIQLIKFSFFELSQQISRALHQCTFECFGRARLQGKSAWKPERNFRSSSGGNGVGWGREAKW